MSADERILLVDGYGQIYRSFYAIRDLSGPDGSPTNALFGVARFLLNLDDHLPHAFGAVVLDKGKPQHRMDLLPEYKATRPPMPEALRSQIEPIRSWAEAMGWAVLQAEGFEADDIIAAIVDVRGDREVTIVSHDKDLGQLVGPGVTLAQAGPKGALALQGEAVIAERFGVPPQGIVDFLALTGDTVDNIPGVPGIGPKTAADLLKRFGSIDGMLAQPDRIERAPLRQKLVDAAEVLRRNRLLVALDRRLPPGWQGIEALRRRQPDWPRLQEMARTFGFKSMQAELQKRQGDARQGSLFGLQ